MNQGIEPESALTLLEARQRVLFALREHTRRTAIDLTGDASLRIVVTHIDYADLLVEAIYNPEQTWVQRDAGGLRFQGIQVIPDMGLHRGEMRLRTETRA